jgi:hypothetical protein
MADARSTSRVMMSPAPGLPGLFPIHVGRFTCQSRATCVKPENEELSTGDGINRDLCPGSAISAKDGSAAGRLTHNKIDPRALDIILAHWNDAG